MPEKRTALITRYRRNETRFAKLMAISEQEAHRALFSPPVTERRSPVQSLDAYRKAEQTERRLYYRRCSRAFGHRLEALPGEQRSLLLCRCRDRMDWEQACRITGYSESGAMKIMRRFEKTKNDRCIKKDRS